MVIIIISRVKLRSTSMLTVQEVVAIVVATVITIIIIPRTIFIATYSLTATR